MPHTIPTPEGNRTVASLADVIDAGIIDPHYRFNWEARFMAEVWNASKGSGSALIVHPTVCPRDYVGADPSTKAVPSHMTAEEWQRWRVQSQRQENERRDRATLEVCLLVLMGYIEGRDDYARRLGERMGGHFAGHELAYGSVPTYTQMRNFLIGELDARPVVAATAAFRQRAFHNKLEAHHRAEYYGGREKVPDMGWL